MPLPVPWRRPALDAARIAALLGALACGEGPPPPRVPERLAISAGDNQQAQVGTQLPTAIAVLVSDRQGPLPGVTVTFAASDPGGFATPETAATGLDGVATSRWTVGGTLGRQFLAISVPGVAPVTVAATVAAGPPAIVSPVSPPSQFTVAGRLVAAPPAARVTDAFGNPLADQPVSFADPTGRSQVVGGEARTDGAGRAGVLSWRIANQAGPFTLVATTENGVSTNFIAFAVPAAVQIAAGTNQSANAGTRLAVAPAILALDDSSRGLPNVAVLFQVAAGGGRVQGNASVTTGPDGLGALGGWILGLTPGENQLRAELQGLPSLTFSATGVAAVPAQVSATSAPTQAGFFGNFLSATPALRVTDAAGQPVAGAPVAFAITAGDGSLTRAATATDFDGRASLGAWRLGPAAATQIVSATAAPLAPVTYTATAVAPPAPAYRIDVRFIGPAPDSAQRAAFDSAAARWQQAILGDLADIPFTPADDLSFCGGQALDETIDDLLIFATIERIDGPGNILGSAGACYIRDDDLLTVVGRMRFDLDDVTALQTSGRFRDVVLHEMGHVIGIGSLWGLKELITGRGTGDPFFTGPAARAAWAAADAAASFTGSVVPIENTGGAGTRDVHWRESVARNELMTGFLNTGANPLSAFTIASLRDEGYVVNDVAEDQFSLVATLQALAAGPAMPMVELPWSVPVRTIDRRGEVRRILPPR
jgi:hypothetical protein